MTRIIFWTKLWLDDKLLKDSNYFYWKENQARLQTFEKGWGGCGYEILKEDARV